MLRMSLKKIAAEVGVNPSTVSRVLRNDKGCYISQDKKVKILDICRKYNYSPNPAARSLVLGKTFNIAFVVREFRHFECFGPFTWTSINGVNEILNQAGYSCSMTVIRNSEDLRKLFFSGAYDGIIFGKDVIGNEFSSCLSDALIPYVFMEDESAVSKDRNRVIVNEQSGVADGIKHLLSLGHRQMAVYGVEPHFDTYGKIFHNHKLSFNEFNCFKIPATDIYNLSALSYIHSRIFTQKDMPFTAICCTNDLVALGLCKRLNEAGIKAGRDVSVMGIDNWEQLLAYPESEHFLTTVDYCRKEIGRETARILLGIIQDPSKKAIEYTVNTKLVIRTSTGPVVRAKYKRNNAE